MSSGILTIDDVASKNTPAIVDYLKEKDITPVMFAEGKKTEEHYEEAIYALQAGIMRPHVTHIAKTTAHADRSG